MSMFGTLERMAHAATPPAVTGQWAALRLALDAATGEHINVGVIFRPDEGLPAWRLLSTVAGLRCMYGPDGAANADFAIDQARAALARHGRLPGGWHISEGARLHASGASSAQIVDSLFDRVVPLARHETAEEERLDGDDHRLSTTKLRRSVREIIRGRQGTREAPSFWRDSPTLVAAPDGHPLRLDLQIWVESGTAVGAMASIVSAWYTSKFHRDSYLNSGHRSMMDARLAQGADDAKAGLFVLRPMSDKRFDKAQLAAIDNEIDTLAWALKKHSVSLDAFDNETSLTNAVLQMA